MINYFYSHYDHYSRTVTYFQNAWSPFLTCVLLVQPYLFLLTSRPYFVVTKNFLSVPNFLNARKIVFPPRQAGIDSWLLCGLMRTLSAHSSAWTSENKFSAKLYALLRSFKFQILFVKILVSRNLLVIIFILQVLTFVLTCFWKVPSTSQRFLNDALFFI